MVQQLRYRYQFEVALENYEMSETGQTLLGHVELTVFLGLSGSGRNTIISELVKTGKYEFVVSDTTRRPRANDGVMEQNGREYWFRSEEEILDDIKNGLFLEAELIHKQQVSGISLRELQRIAGSGKHPVTDIDLEGAINIQRLKGVRSVIVVVPPDFEAWMKRVDSRGDMAQEEKTRRLETALRILSFVKQHKLQVVINDDLSEAVDRCRGAIEHDQPLTVKGTKAEAVVDELESGIKKILGLR